MVHTNNFYEILAQISDPKIEFSTKTYFLFCKMTMFKLSGNAVSGGKKTSGVLPQQNTGCKQIPEYSRPNSDQLISKKMCFYTKFIEHRGFSAKIDKTKKLKLLRKLSCDEK